MNLIINDDCQIPDLADIYSKYLPDKGVLVEVGAYDGVTHSNTLPLLRAGWTGLCIEPVHKHYKECLRNLKDYKVKILNNAVGSAFGTLLMQSRGEWSTLSREYGEIVDTHPSGVGTADEETVKCATLTEILANETWKNIDLLVIDVEGYEYEVLAGFDIEQYQPTMMIIELHEQSEFWMQHKRLKYQAESINLWLTQYNDYEKIYSDDINSIFIKK